MPIPSVPNQRLLRALLRQPVDKTPIWLMRQAGRYLPEYRALRAKAGDFMGLCKTPELACEVTLQPLQRFDLDAAILFSDILTIPDAMGCGLYFTEGEGPKFRAPVQNSSAVGKLGSPDPETNLAYVMNAIRLVRHELQGRIPLLGFAGSPWTLATYMIEGGSSKNFNIIKTMMKQEPKTLHQLLQLLSQAVTDYLNAQIKAGVDGIMLFDTWGGILSTPNFHTFSLNYMAQIIAGLIKERDGVAIPTILFTKFGGRWLNGLAATGCHAISLDWTIDIAQARAKVGHRVALQGNLDPTILLTDPTKIYNEAKDILKRFGEGTGHIFNLGHGVLPETPPEHVAVLIDAVHELSIPYHSRTD